MARGWKRAGQGDAGALLATVALSVTAGAGVAAVQVWVAALPYLALAAPLVLLALVGRGRLQRPFLSPPWVLCLPLSAIGALGYMFHEGLHELGGASVSLATDAALATRTAYLYALLSGAIAVGALAVAVWRRRTPPPGVTPPTRRTRDWALAACSLVPLVGFLNYGSNLVSRPEHLAGAEGAEGVGGGPNFYTPLESMSVGAVAICGYLFATETRGRKAAACLAAVLFFVLAFGLSSRRLAMYPLLFAVGYAINRRGRRGAVTMAAGVVGSVLLLPLPLFLRGLPWHGLEPYFAGLGQFSYGDVDWLASANNVLVSFPITAYAAFAYPAAPIGWLWVELNPMPGNAAGWYDISGFLRINWATPFSTVGGLGNYGTVAVVTCGLVLGALLAYLDGRVGNYLRQGAQLLALVIVAMSGLMAVSALQYNVRSFARLVLYTLAAEAFARAVLASRAASARRAEAEARAIATQLAWAEQIRQRKRGVTSNP